MTDTDFTFTDRLYGTCSCEYGQNVIGIGPVGTDDRGPQIVTATDGVVSDGSYSRPYYGTGGSVQNCKILASGVASGDGIRITALDPAHRSGEMLLHRLLVYGDGSGNRGTFNRGVVVDGSMLDKPGEAGIRRVIMDDVRAADCRNECILLNNAVHCCMEAVQIDTGGGAPAVMRIVGGQNITGENMVINGKLIIEGSAVDLNLSGRFDEVIIRKSVRACVVNGPVRKLTIESGATGAFFGVYRELEYTRQWFAANFYVIGGKV